MCRALYIACIYMIGAIEVKKIKTQIKTCCASCSGGSVGFNRLTTLIPQRSLEDEINRTTAEDIPIFMISYAVIFVYIAVALGEYSSWKRILVKNSGKGKVD